MRRLSIALLSLGLLACPALFGAFAATDYLGSESGGVLSVYDRAGNALQVSNRSDGASSYIQLASYGPRGLNWQRTHSDGYDERAMAVHVDAAGNLYVVGGRVWQNVRYFWVMKYSPNGNLVWERTDSEAGCLGFDVAANENGDAWAAGSCIDNGRFPVRVMRIDASGNVSWVRSYDEGGRNYVRGLNVDLAGRAAVTIEISASSGRYVRTAVFNTDGGRLAVY